MRVLALSVLSALLLVLSAPASADAMRCGSKLVGNGDPRSKVREFCGEPTDVQTRAILRSPSYTFRGRPIYFGHGVVEIPVEIWTYNFGPYKLMRRVRFIDGLVEDIDTLGYGYHSTGPANLPPDDSTLRDTYR
jgi:hypothetical protein